MVFTNQKNEIHNLKSTQAIQCLEYWVDYEIKTSKGGR